jgi:hypothetical protein
MVGRPSPQPPRRAETVPDRAVAQIIEALDRIRFGDIRLTVHEGRLVQIDITERTRFSQT